MKRIFSLMLTAAVLVGALAGCGGSAQPSTLPSTSAAAAPSEASEAPETTAPAIEPALRQFTDDAGRTVTLPAELTRVAVSGPLTQMYLLPLCGEKLVGFARTDAMEQKYLSAQLEGLPELGQLYGGKGTMDLEALLASGAQAVIDVGEAKDSIAEDFDALTAQTGIPFLHLEATVSSSAEAYRRLGELLGCEDRAEELAAYCERTLAETNAIMEQVDADGARKTILYCLGDKGVNVLAEKSFHAETLSLVAKNVADLQEVVSKGTGNEVDLEQILLWDPEVLLFAPDSCYDSVLTDPAWQSLQAVQSGSVYETPCGPYGWLASPPSVQRFLGMQWLCALLYPEYVSYDLQERVTEYYELFYGFTLEDSAYQELTEHAMP